MDFISFLTILFLSLSYYRIEGSILSKLKEDVKIEQQLEILNKSPVKTIQDETNDIFDCVEIGKQPAFEHPLLKNHKIQMELSPHLEKLINKTTPANLHSTLMVKSIGCPQGTVPIRRTRKEDFIKIDSFLPSLNVTIHPQTKQLPGQHRALWGTKITQQKYVGAEANINIQSPRTKSSEFSTGQMWIEESTSFDTNVIQTGWVVFPRIFGDSKPRLFIYWQEAGGKKPCFNYLCPGFVQTDKDHTLGHILPTSYYDGKQEELSLSIQQDQKTKNWWLIASNRKYGYLPSELFPYMKGGVSRVAWGGLVKGTVESSPQMGSGYFPDHNYYHSSYFINFQAVYADSGRNTCPDHFGAMESVNDNPNCYGLGEIGRTQELNCIFQFGGPGGYCGV